MEELPVIFFKENKITVFNLPSDANYKQAIYENWNELIWDGSIKVIGKGQLFKIYLLNKDESHFGICPLTKKLDESINKCIDNTRAFSVRLQSENNQKNAWIGVVFHEIMDALEFSTCLSQIEKDMDPNKDLVIQTTDKNAEKWKTLESNEIYVIKSESLKKTNDWIVYKIQKEAQTKGTKDKLLAKRGPQSSDTSLDIIKYESTEFKKRFCELKDIFSVVSDSKKSYLKKEDKIKKKLHTIGKEVRLQNVTNIKDVDIAKHYMYEMARERMNQRPTIPTSGSRTLDDYHQ